MQDATEVLSKLEYLQNKYMKVVNSIDSDDLNTRIQEGEDGWTTIEMLRHIPVSEEEIIELVQKVVSGSEGVPEDFSIDQQNAKFRDEYADMGIEQAQQQMKKAREKTLAFMKNTSPDNWNKKGRYFNREEMTVARMFQILMWHQNHHLKQIIEKLHLDL